MTLLLDKPLTRNSLDLFLQRILWENRLKDSAGKVANVIRLKVSAQGRPCADGPEPQSQSGKAKGIRTELNRGVVLPSTANACR